VTAYLETLYPDEEIPTSSAILGLGDIQDVICMDSMGPLGSIAASDDIKFRPQSFTSSTVVEVARGLWEAAAQTELCMPVQNLLVSLAHPTTPVEEVYQLIQDLEVQSLQYPVPTSTFALLAEMKAAYRGRTAESWSAVAAFVMDKLATVTSKTERGKLRRGRRRPTPAAKICSPRHGDLNSAAASVIGGGNACAASCGTHHRGVGYLLRHLFGPRKLGTWWNQMMTARDSTVHFLHEIFFVVLEQTSQTTADIPICSICRLCGLAIFHPDRTSSEVGQHFANHLVDQSVLVCLVSNVQPATEQTIDLLPALLALEMRVLNSVKEMLPAGCRLQYLKTLMSRPVLDAGSPVKVAPSIVSAEITSQTMNSLQSVRVRCTPLADGIIGLKRNVTLSADVWYQIIKYIPDLVATMKNERASRDNKEGNDKTKLVREAIRSINTSAII
jgi:hypothetical protein